MPWTAKGAEQYGAAYQKLRKQLIAAARAGQDHCGYCARRLNEGQRLSVDHIVPVSRGGTSERWNLRVVCYSCNLKAGSALGGRARTPRTRYIEPYVGRPTTRW